MRIRESPVVGEFQVPISIGIVFMVKQIVQRQCQGIIFRNIINGIPSHARQRWSLRIRSLWLARTSIVFSVAQVFPRQCTSDLIRPVSHRRHAIQSGRILYPPFITGWIIDFRITIRQPDTALSLDLWETSRFYF